MTQQSRREFLGTTAAATTLTLAPHLEAARKGEERQTLFFNLSHEDHEGHTYYFVLGKNRYFLERVQEGHPTLARARQTNVFLRALPAGAVTHVIENIQLPDDAVLLGYTIKDPDTSTGTWAMSSIYLHVPTSQLSYAYTRARKNLLDGEPLPVSAKRMKYGVPAAVSLKDLADEHALLDSTDWAKAMVNVHPEMLSADPKSASNIQNNHIDARSTFQLSQQLELAGPAIPQQSGAPDDSNNSTGWATLVPYTDEDGITPLKNTTGNNNGLILYDARWQPSIQTFVAAALKPTSAAVKNDTTLGADVTAGREAMTTTDLLGTIWARRDGITSVDQSPQLRVDQSPDNASYTLTNVTPYYNGYSLSASVVADTGEVTLNFTNWYLRWLGLYIQFYDGTSVVGISQIPKGISSNSELDLKDSNSIFLGLLTPEFTIYGVPVMSSKLPVKFTFPTSVATSAAILASGLGYGSHTAPDTEDIGIINTAIFNLILPGLLLCLGLGAAVDDFYKDVVLVAVVAQNFLIDLFALCEGATLKQIGTIFWRLYVRFLTSPPALNTFIKSVIQFLTTRALIQAAEDAIPLVGAIIQAIGAVGTVAEIAETAAEVGVSPWTYQYQLVGMHDVTVTILHASNDPGGFPATAANYTVTAVFDGGTPQVQTLPITNTNPPDQKLQATFQNVPLGGTLTVHVGFYTSDGTLVGHGSTSGANDVNANPTIQITEDQVPIKSRTAYIHKQKTTLDPQGNHMWSPAEAPAAAAPACDANPGNLCSFRDITVSPLGYIGYGWQSYSTAGCASAGAGQLDQMANIFVSNGSGNDAQSGYTTTPCALEPGTRLVYDSLGRAGANYYLDSTNNQNLVRQVQLVSPPAFADPRSNSAWGKFNLHSDDLLLHPAGVLISINSENSRMESLRLPDKAISYADAAVSLLANFHGGLGARPGLFSAPTVATITSHGVILIVEAGNNRIHAVDAAGNPVRHFLNQPEPYFLNLSETGGDGTEYLDIAVEFSGFIYVLSSNNSAYRLDIYNPDQTGTDPFCSTQGFNAAKLTVDYWRNVYSLNYEALMVNSGLPASGITEPSISQWVPVTPPGVGRIPPPRHRRKRDPEQARLLRRRDLWRT
jgi:hypothetical protein